MAQGFLKSPERNTLLILAAALCAVVAATAFGQIKLNAWNRPFYDSISNKDLSEFLYQLVVFAEIATGLLILNVAQIWLNQTTKWKLREQLTRDLIGQWLMPTRALRLAGDGEIGVNPDQRIHEDVRHLTELTTDLGIGLLQATLLLLSFIGVLWILSAHVSFNIFGWSATIPGYMVWCALIYAGAASWLSWRVGRPLISLNAERYAREADLRFGLVRVNEHANGIAIYGGERDEKGRLERDLDQVLAVMRRLVSGMTRLTWVTAGYGWFAIVAPVVVAAPGVFGGDLSLGGLMVVIGAFNQVQQALRWFVDNFSTIADWRATLLRVSAFRMALVEMDKLGDQTGKIERTETADSRLIFDDLGVAAPAGCTGLGQPHIVIEPREHVLIIGPAGAGKTNLFRALAGIWPWGCGRILLPPLKSMIFMSERPYLPPGALRDTLAYPAPSTKFEPAEYVAALDRMRLSRLSPMLERSARWDRELDDLDQQRLAFARLLLHKPAWVIIDGAIDSLDEADRNLVFDIFDHELKGTAIISIGRFDAHETFFTRVLRLLKYTEGVHLVPCSVEDTRPDRASRRKVAG